MRTGRSPAGATGRFALALRKGVMPTPPATQSVGEPAPVGSKRPYGPSTITRAPSRSVASMRAVQSPRLRMKKRR